MFAKRNNLDRAETAKQAVDVYAKATCSEDEDSETKVSDLLCDLMHLCDLEGLDFKRSVERADSHYSDEWEEEND